MSAIYQDASSGVTTLPTADLAPAPAPVAVAPAPLPNVSVPTTPIVRPGVAYIDTGGPTTPGPLLVAPPASPSPSVPPALLVPDVSPVLPFTPGGAGGTDAGSSGGGLGSGVVPTRINPVPGRAYIDVSDPLGPPVLIPAPPATGSILGGGLPSDGTPSTEADGAGARGASLFDFGAPLTDAFELDALNPPLSGAAFVAAVRDVMAAHDVDPFAACVNGYYEGFGGTVGDGGEAYGPWQDWMTYFKGRPWYGAGKNNARVNAWAWSRPGIEYVARAMAQTKAAGESGAQATWDICYWYERPTRRLGDANDRQDAARALLDSGQDYWKFFAAHAAGAVGVKSGPAAPASGSGSAAGRPVSVATDWQNFLDVFKTDLPRERARIKANAEGLVSIFQ